MLLRRRVAAFLPSGKHGVASPRASVPTTRRRAPSLFAAPRLPINHLTYTDRSFPPRPFGSRFPLALRVARMSTAHTAAAVVAAAGVDIKSAPPTSTAAAGYAKPSKAKLYGNPLSSWSRAILHYITEFNVKEVEVVTTDHGIKEAQHKTKEFTAINPVQRVPALVVDNGFILTESSAILKYIAETWGPSPSHYPASNTDERAKVDQMMEWIQTDMIRFLIESVTLGQWRVHGKRESKELQDKVFRVGSKQVLEKLCWVDQCILGGGKKYLCGDHLTIADFFFFCAIYNLKPIAASLTPFTNLLRWWSQMEQLKSFPIIYKDMMELVGKIQKEKTELGIRSWDDGVARSALEKFIDEEKKRTTGVSDSKSSGGGGSDGKANNNHFILRVGTTGTGTGAGTGPLSVVEQWLTLGGGTKLLTAAGITLTLEKYECKDVMGYAYPPALPPMKLIQSNGSGFELTDASVILRYFGSKCQNQHIYPSTDIHSRARINEIIAWFHSKFTTLFHYHFIFPQSIHQTTRWNGDQTLVMKEAEWCKPQVMKELMTLEKHWLNHGKGSFVLPNTEQPSIADFFCFALLDAGSLIGMDLSDRLNITRWQRAMQTVIHSKPLAVAPAMAGIVSIRASPDSVISITRQSLALGKESEYRTWYQTTGASMYRDAAGCVSVNCGVEPDQSAEGGGTSTAVIVRLWQNKASFVNDALLRGGTRQSSLLAAGAVTAGSVESHSIATSC